MKICLSIFFKGRNEDNEEFPHAVSEPNTLFVEILLVTDSSVYNDHERFAGTKDKNTIFMHMKIYFSHLMNGVQALIKVY